MKHISLIFLLAFSINCTAQHHAHPEEQRKIVFPDVPGYQTLITDLHMHTVFSDGYVWPTIRVQEALRENLDAIAVTEHLEYLPHKDDIPLPDHNRAYEIEKKEAKKRGGDLLVIRGSEITRKMPPGHANAIFLKDANKLVVDDPIDAFRQAKKQGAFIFWNHPNWVRQRSDGMATLLPEHRELIRDGMMHGIEVVNHVTYSDEALQIALDHDLAIIGTSDIHGLVDWEYKIPEGGHRPVTLVFATERSIESLKEALFARRTVVWFNNNLIGRSEHLLPLIKSCLTVTEAKYPKDITVLDVTISNNSDVEFILQNRGEFRFHANSDVLTLKPHSSTKLMVKTGKALAATSLKFEVLNAVTAPNTHPEIELKVAVGE